MLQNQIVLTILFLARHHQWDVMRDYIAFVRGILDDTSKLSPEDQAKLNQIFDRATATGTKLEEAQKT